jgi:uncharacterized damage-inducible protein DinB
LPGHFLKEPVPKRAAKSLPRLRKAATPIALDHFYLAIRDDCGPFEFVRFDHVITVHSAVTIYPGGKMPETKMAAQSSMQSAPTKMIDPILMELDQEAQTTRRVLERIPGDKLAWRPHPKSFSLGQLALHIAVVQGNIAAASIPDTMEAPIFAQAEAKSCQEVLEAFSQSIEKARASLKNMDDATLTAPWSLTRNGKVVFTVPRIAFLRSIMLNHIYHHRGQLSVYLRMLEVPVPSIYGPSADENPFVA